MGLLDALTGGGDDGSDAAKAAIARNRAILEGIALPEYEQYIPELDNYESANYELIDEDPTLRQAQQDYLQRMAGFADDGLTEADEAAFTRARQEGNQVAKGNTEAAIQNANARGVGGSGLEFAMREAGNQAGAERALTSGLSAAETEAKNKFLYNQAFGDAVSGSRDQDYRANSANTGIINQFNLANTNNRNQTNQSNVNAKNTAFQYNQGLKDKNFNNQMGKATGQTNLNNQEADVAMAEAEAKRKKQAGLTGLAGAGAGAMLGGPAGAGLGYNIGSNL